MMDQPKDYVAEAGKAEPKRGRSKLKQQKNPTPTDLSSKPSTYHSDTSSVDGSLSKAVPGSPRFKLVIEGKEATLDPTQAFGINDPRSMLILFRHVLGTTLPCGEQAYDQALDGTLAILRGIAPRDALEGLLAVQMVGVHNMAMESLRRAALAKDSELIDSIMNRAVRLLRTFAGQMEVLNRHRGKGGQQMVVGNVNVNDGGQAIVGTVNKPV